MAYTGSLSEALQKAADYLEENQRFLPMYLHLLVSALFPIYAGAHASLSRPLSAGRSKKKPKDDIDEDDEEEEEDDVQKMEGLSNRDAIVFPITAGVVLASLYFLIKKFGANLINLVLGVYFSLIGTYSVGKIINDAWTTIESFVSPTYYVDQGKLWKVNNSERKVIAVDTKGKSDMQRSSPLTGPLGRLPLPEPLLSLAWSLKDLTKQKFKVKGYLKDHFDFSVVLTRHNAISSVLGASAIAYSILVGKPWWLTNLQGFAVSYGALQLMSPTTFVTGSLILTGLFFYDIWAVFFTPLMVTVAKNLDVPIKLVFPRPDEPGAPGEPPIKSFSMLGLGDIVLPGLMIALALRFDLHTFYLRKQKTKPESIDEHGEKEVEFAPYVAATGHWGDKFWTRGATSSSSLRAVMPELLTTSFPKPYFTATMVGYVFGMLSTLIVMTVFQHAQPALLYLVPGVLISLWGTGLVRGELKHMLDYSEALTLDPAETKDGKKAETTPEDNRSLFQWLKDELLGTETKSEQQKAQDGKKTDDIADGADMKSAEKKVKSSGADDGVVISLYVTHHKFKGASASTQIESPSSEKDGQAHRTSESISEDTVVVSSTDLDVPNDSESHKRRVTRGKGYSEK
ncbi:hypothetical protein M409DRAFT_17456 [Zasmidium cellare ATCC 36951]|uniref:Signal peptide peptidase n=1 Tax=Zasmidium cellare ATCC 36951 TaxID=1080233 RepID=A0A6A6CYB6_ZASCE|nr:uncharacterized protein M409DRAFT_17456 [Zasmidium cellare ATCC 36951]KAF2172217.1 hypothetical protein M409DRAFT_17456 [Zasmidium cellare ATCC 36951]